MSKDTSYKNSKDAIWLNVASSTYVLKDFVNLDNNIFLKYLNVFVFFKRFIPRKYWDLTDRYNEAKNKAQLIQHDCRKPLFFSENSVDHILCSHFLEHVYPDEMKRIINDFFRVMKFGATLHIIVPDLKIQAEEYLNQSVDEEAYAADRFIEKTLLSKKSRGSFKYRMLELHGGFGLQHLWMYDYSSMASKLRTAGFTILSENETPSKHVHLDDNESVHVAAQKQ